MTDLNCIHIQGNLTRDCGSDERDYGFMANGSARANLSIAVNRSKKQGDEWIDEVSYFDVTVFGKTAENLKPYFTKGQKITVEGYLKQDRWTDQQGNKKSRIGIVAEHVWLAGSKKDSGSNTQTSTQNNYQPAAESYDNSTGFQEDIPF